jgi:hypothetical protein
MSHFFRRFRTLLLAFAAFFALSSASFAVIAGWPFYHQYTIDNYGQCDMKITGFVKSWSSTDGVLAKVDYTRGTSTAANGTAAYDPNFTIPAGVADPDTYITFYTKTCKTGYISSSLAYSYEYHCRRTETDALGNTTTRIEVIPGTGTIAGPVEYIQDGTGCGEHDSTTSGPTTSGPTTSGPTTSGPTTSGPTTSGPTTSGPTTSGPTTSGPTTSGPTTSGPTTSGPGGGGDNSGGESCYFAQACAATDVEALGRLPTYTSHITPTGEVALTIASTGNCLNPQDICVQVRDSAIVGNYTNAIREGDRTDWSACLPNDEIRIEGTTLYLPVQYKSAYAVRFGTYIHQHPQTGSNPPRWGDINTFQPGNLGEICYFDTRICNIDTAGVTRSEALGGSCTDTGSVGDPIYTEARNLMNPSVARLLQPYEHGFSQGGCDASGLGVVVHELSPEADYWNNNLQQWLPLSQCYSDRSDEVVYFDPPSGGSVTLDAAGSDFVLPAGRLTMVVKGADVQIKDNLLYPVQGGDKASFGIIGLKTLTGGREYGSNIYIGPDPTNIVGAYYSEGSVETAMPTAIGSWTRPTNRNDKSWFEKLKNQLLIEGTIIALNTIGGAYDPMWPRYETPKCPSSITVGWVSCSWAEAVKYDLAQLREYHRCVNDRARTDYPNYNPVGCTAPNDVVATGRPAVGAPSDQAVVIRYDSRIESNPPPGFEALKQMLQNEVGL